MRNDHGYKLHVGALSPQYVETVMSDETFNTILANVYTETCDAVKKGLRLHRESCMQLGYHGPFLGAQLDLTTVANEEYITFSVSYIPEGATEISRVGLATRAFPGSHTAADIEPWIEKARSHKEYVSNRQANWNCVTCDIVYGDCLWILAKYCMVYIVLLYVIL